MVPIMLCYYVSYSSYLYYIYCYHRRSDIDMIWTQKYLDTVTGAVIVLDWLLVRLLLGSQKKTLDLTVSSEALVWFVFFDQVWNF